MSKILLLEDDKLFAGTVKDLLEEEGFEVKMFHNGVDAENCSYEENFDLFILDINLPDISGFDVIKTIRENGNEKPILFLTSTRDKETLLKSYKLGGDEYLTKPVDFDELIVRIDALLKRSGGVGKIELANNFLFDLSKKALYKDEKLVEMGSKTASLLALFIANQEKAVTKDMIDAELYSNQSYSEGSVRVYVNQLNTIFGEKVISNIRGIGYKFEQK